MKDIVIVDIDGTIIVCELIDQYLENHSSPDFDFIIKYENNRPVNSVIELVKLLSTKYKILFLTSRSKRHYEETIKTLKILFEDMDYDLIMRNNNDNRADDEYKKQTLTELGFLNRIFLILEDRTCVVQMWRKMGFTCLQVANGDY